MSKQVQHQSRPPLRWTGILFAFAANLLLATLASMIAERLTLTGLSAWLLPLFAAFAAGVLTTLYVRGRGAMHAFLGSIIAMPIATTFIFQGIWQFGIYFLAASTIGAALLETLGFLQNQPTRPKR